MGRRTLHPPLGFSVKGCDMVCMIQDGTNSVASDSCTGVARDPHCNAMSGLIGTDDVQSEVRVAVLVHLHAHTTHGSWRAGWTCDAVTQSN